MQALFEFDLLLRLLELLVLLRALRGIFPAAATTRWGRMVARFSEPLIRPWRTALASVQTRPVGSQGRQFDFAPLAVLVFIVVVRGLLE